MGFKMKRKLKKLMASVLVAITVISSSSIEVFASGGADAGGSQGGAGLMKGSVYSSGFAIGMLEIDNPNAGDVTNGTIELALEELYLTEGAPAMEGEFFNKCFIVSHQNKGVILNNNFYCTGPDTNVKITKNKMWMGSGAGGAAFTPFQLDTLVGYAGADADITKVSYEDWYATRKNGNAAAINAFSSSMWDSKKWQDALKSFMVGGVTNSGTSDLAYLDLLTMVNYMSDDAYTEYIRTFLDCWNKPGSDKFVVGMVIPLAQTRSAKGAFWWSSATFMGAAFGRGPDDFATGGANRKGGTAVYNDNPWENADIDAFIKITGGAVPNGMSNNMGVWASPIVSSYGKRYMTSNNYDWRYMCLPTNSTGNETGNSGYTFFARLNSWMPTTGTPIRPAGEVYLEARPKGEVLSGPGSVTKADISISLAQPNREYYMKIMNAMAVGGRATVTLTLSANIVSGSLTNDIFANSVSGGSGSGNTITVTWNNSAEAKAYLDGTNTISVIDTGITVNSTTDYKYRVSGYIDWANPSKAPRATLSSRGVLDVGTTSAADIASWIVPVDVPHYYSYPRDPFVEIKEGSPNNESFEAMAGVPTTENMYVGFGATEFMTNVELEYKTQTATRAWTMSATITNCWGANANCAYTCPGKTYGPAPEGGGPPPVTHDGPHSANACGGASCADPSTQNQWHPRTHTNTYTVTSPIDQFAYMDITDLELWQVQKLIMNSDPKLFNPHNITIDPDTGYRSYFNQDKYSPGNGRLIFNKSLSGEKYSNTSASNSFNCGAACNNTATSDPGDIAAAAWANGLTSGTVTVTAVSDFAVLATTAGFQSMMYYDYNSNATNIRPSDFQIARDWQSLTSPNITWPRVPTQDDMWKNNGLSSANWESSHITRTGYNGKFASPSSKWNNSNSVSGNDPSSKLGSHPNLQADGHSGTSSGSGFGNLRMTRTGINIIDSTTAGRAWSDSDGVEPVNNGEWDTKHCYLEAPKVINYNSPAAKEWGANYRTEVPYSPSHNKVNNIVIHNPVSVKYNVVLSNDKKYDQRTADSLAAGGDPPSKEKGCPKSDKCVFSKLTCTASHTLHNSSCKSNVQVGYKHVGGLNKHEHVPGCGTLMYQWQCYNVSCCHGNGGSKWVASNTNPGGCAIGNAHCRGLYLTGATRWDYSTVGGGGTWRALYSGRVEYPAGGLNVYTFTAIADGNVNFYSSWNNKDPVGRIYVNGALRVSDDDSGGGYNFNLGTFVKAGDVITFNVVQYGSSGDGMVDVVAQTTIPEAACDNTPNKHVCTPQCGPEYMEVITCIDPHHYSPGEPHDPKASSSHYSFPDGRCYSPCMDDAKHKTPTTINPPGENPASGSDVFINLDREFKIYAPNLGDFAMRPDLHGIASCTSTNGMGYRDNMDTTKWIREKYVVFPVNVIDSKGRMWLSGEYIDLYDLPNKNYVYEFYAILNNIEQINAATEFLAIGNNAKEVKLYDESNGTTNIQRLDPRHNAKHTAYKKQHIDVVGYIGNLTLNDTGDFRFANLFKQRAADGGWMIDNLVPRVNYKAPNKVLSDGIDIRQETANASTKWHSTYGVTAFASGGKSFQHVSLPLTPAKNNITALQNQPMRPGYQLYLDIETVGNYYGENYDDNNTPIDVDMWNKLQVTPKYWSLNLDTKKYTPVDVYMGINNEYSPVVKFNEKDKAYEYLYYLDWLEESMRRNYSVNEQTASTSVREAYSEGSTTGDGIDTGVSKNKRMVRLPITTPDVIGAANRLFLNDLNRTFIGSSSTYGVYKNPGERVTELGFRRQSQRWHWTLGLPSSAVFVEAGKPCTDANIKALADSNSVIVSAVNIIVRGSVWNLKYNGSTVNNSDGGGFRVVPGGTIYPPPVDPETGRPLEDPIINVYHPKRTSKDDLRTEGIS